MVQTSNLFCDYTFWLNNIKEMGVDKHTHTQKKKLIKGVIAKIQGSDSEHKSR